MAREKKGKNLNFFSKHHYVTGLGSEVFYLFKRRNCDCVMGRGKKRLGTFFKTTMQFFSSSCII